MKRGDWPLRSLSGAYLFLQPFQVNLFLYVFSRFKTAAVSRLLHLPRPVFRSPMHLPAGAQNLSRGQITIGREFEEHGLEDAVVDLPSWPKIDSSARVDKILRMKLSKMGWL